MNDSIEINNSKVFNKSLERINSFDLKGEERLIKRFNVNLGTNSVMVFFGTNEKFETSYFTDAIDKMIFQRIVGLAVKKGVTYNKDGFFEPIAIPVIELIGEIKKRNINAKELTSVDEIINRLYAMRHIDILVNSTTTSIDQAGSSITEIRKACKPLLNVDYMTKEVVHDYNKKIFKKSFIVLRDFPDLWFATEQCKNEILYFPRFLFDFKTIKVKTADLEKIPARENLFYQMLKENIVLEIANRKYFLKSHGLIKPCKNGFYKLPVDKVGLAKWECDRRINFSNFLASLGVLDDKGKPMGKYKDCSSLNLLKNTKRDIIGILAALKEKGFIDDYYEYKLKNNTGKNIFAGWVVDPSVEFDKYYLNKRVIDNL